MFSHLYLYERSIIVLEMRKLTKFLDKLAATRVRRFHFNGNQFRNVSNRNKNKSHKLTFAPCDAMVRKAVFKKVKNAK